MGDKQREELMSSLKELYTSGKYSDLNISCRDKQFRLHKAIVCPRSEVFASMCDRSWLDDANNGIGSFRLNDDDDPMAMDMLFHYLYHLDYPSFSEVSEHISSPVSTVEGKRSHNNSISSSHGNELPNWLEPRHSHHHHDDSQSKTINGYMIVHSQTQTQTQAQDQDQAQDAPPDETLPERTLEATKDETQLVDNVDEGSTTGGVGGLSKKRRKKARKKSEVPQQQQPAGILALPDEQSAIEDPSVETAAPAPASLPPRPPSSSPLSLAALDSSAVLSSPTTTVTVPDNITTTITTTTTTVITTLITHAKVYALSKKYRVAGLTALALEKFVAQVQQRWSSDEFLLAAREVYMSTETEDKEIRQAVTSTLYDHPELLDKEDVRKTIRGLELGFDLVMWIRSKGGF